jgi:hypothetical protein
MVTDRHSSVAMGTSSSSKHEHGGGHVAQRKKKDQHAREDVSQREQGVRHVLKGDAVRGQPLLRGHVGEQQHHHAHEF